MRSFPRPRDRGEGLRAVAGLVDFFEVTLFAHSTPLAVLVSLRANPEGIHESFV